MSPTKPTSLPPPPAEGDLSDALPPDLYGIIRTGAVFAGDVVVEVVVITASGRKQRLQLPTPTGKAGIALSRSKRKILDELKASNVPLTRIALAHRCGLDDATGRFGSNVRELLTSGLIYSSGDDVTDDPAKFV